MLVKSTCSNLAVARNAMIVPNGEPRKFEYTLNRQGTKWQIVDIVVDGISDLALKRAQYASILDREGLNSLLAKLSQKIAEYAKK